jgi:hypothetical protein
MDKSLADEDKNVGKSSTGKIYKEA